MDTLLNYAQVQKIVNRSRTSIWRDVRAGRFPQPIKLGTGAVRFRASDLEIWMVDPHAWEIKNGHTPSRRVA